MMTMADAGFLPIDKPTGSAQASLRTTWQRIAVASGDASLELEPALAVTTGESAALPAAGLAANDGAHAAVGKRRA